MVRATILTKKMPPALSLQRIDEFENQEHEFDASRENKYRHDFESFR